MEKEPKSDQFRMPEKVFEYPESERLRDAEGTVSGSKERHPLISVLLRATASVALLLILVFFLILSAIPYGGGGGALISLIWLSLFCLPVWVLLPLKRFLSR
jgi:hypothetical protein